MQLNGKTVIVTGGSDGIGKHICLKLAAEGCKLAILGRNQDRLAQVAEEARSLGAPEARSYGADMTDPAAISGAAAALANIGPGLGDQIGPAGNFAGLNDTAKWMLSLAMFLGRLELLAVYAIFTVHFWRA